MLSDLVSLLLDTLSLGWRDHAGWRFWYGAGASLTLLLLALRIAPWALRFFRETQWSVPAILMAGLVWTVGPLALVTAATFVWPAVLVWLLRGVAGGPRAATVR